MRKFWTWAAAAMLTVAVAAPAVQAQMPSHDLDVLSSRVVEPLAVHELSRSMAPVHLRRASRQEQSTSGSEARLAYTYHVQLADGSMMTVPEAYNVTRTGEHVQQGKFSDLTVYAVRREGSPRDEVVVGLQPGSNEVVLLSPNPSALRF